MTPPAAGRPAALAGWASTLRTTATARREGSSRPSAVSGRTQSGAWRGGGSWRRQGPRSREPTSSIRETHVRTTTTGDHLCRPRGGRRARIDSRSARRRAIATRWISRRGLHDAWLQATAQCDGPIGNPACPAGSDHATIEIHRSEILLADDTPPNAGTATGSAVTSTSWQGTQTFSFPASDQGGGVYQAILEVDGEQMFARTINDWSGRCVDSASRPAGVPISTALSSVGRRARAGGRQCPASGRPRRRPARLRRRRQRADGLRGTEGDRGARSYHRAGQRTR